MNFATSSLLSDVIGDGMAGNCPSLSKLFFHLAQLSHWFTHHAVSFRIFPGLDNFMACIIASSDDWAHLVVSLSLTLGVVVGRDEVIEVVAIIIYVLVRHSTLLNPVVT